MPADPLKMLHNVPLIIAKAIHADIHLKTERDIETLRAMTQ